VQSLSVSTTYGWWRQKFAASIDADQKETKIWTKI
jgi:hypothetical protein